MPERVGDGIPIPDVIDPPESMMMSLCIPKNRDHMSAFFGALYQLTIWNSWQEDEAHSGKELAAVWWRYYLSWNRSMSDIDCEDGMSDCCTEPAIIRRINPTTGNIEQSTNGGATWSPASGGIQSYIVQPLPPVTSGVAATKCDAASNVREQCSQWVDQVSNDFDTATTLLEFGQLVILAIVGAVLTVLTAGALTAVEVTILTALGSALVAMWGAGKAVFDAYWTEDKLDKILCAAYCNIGSDGSFTDAQFSGFWNDCNGDLPPSPAKMLFMGFLSSVGMAGVNSMAASGLSADSDCGDCPCAPCAEKWKINPAGVPPGYHGSIIARDGNSFTLQSSRIVDGGTGQYYAWAWTENSDVCCEMIQAEAIEGNWLATDVARVVCGQPNVDIYINGNPDGTNIWSIFIKSSVRFTAVCRFPEE